MIDLCDSDEDVVEVMKEEKGASRNGDKENSPDEVEVIPPREPTRADLAAAAAKRRAQYEAHIASFGGGGGGGYVRGGQIVSGAIGAIGATGRATGPHLDWRMSWFNQRIDPQMLVPPMSD